MEFWGLILMVSGVLVFVALNFKRFIMQKKTAESFKKEIQENPNLEDLQKKNQMALQSLEKFLKGSNFYEFIGQRGDIKIYRYILNSGKLYKFEDLQSPSNLKSEVNDDFLMFKGLIYKREADVTEFSKKFLSKETDKPEIVVDNYNVGVVEVS